MTDAGGRGKGWYMEKLGNVFILIWPPCDILFREAFFCKFKILNCENK